MEVADHQRPLVEDEVAGLEVPGGHQAPADPGLRLDPVRKAFFAVVGPVEDLVFRGAEADGAVVVIVAALADGARLLAQETGA